MKPGGQKLHRYEFAERGAIPVKGKGLMPAYLLVRRKVSVQREVEQLAGAVAG